MSEQAKGRGVVFQCVSDRSVKPPLMTLKILIDRGDSYSEMRFPFENAAEVDAMMSMLIKARESTWGEIDASNFSEPTVRKEYTQ